MLLLSEAMFVLVALCGVALWSVPAALVLAGVLGVLAVERAAAARKAARLAEAKGGTG